MTDETPISQRAEARAAARKRRTRSRERREVVFELFVSGYTHHQIAEALGTSPLTIRRLIDNAVDERRLDAPDHYVRVQVARLTKAIRVADLRLDQGDLKALAPYAQIIALMDRYHNLDWRLPRPAAVAALPRPPLALPRPAPPIEPEREPDGADLKDK